MRSSSADIERIDELSARTDLADCASSDQKDTIGADALGEAAA